VTPTLSEETDMFASRFSSSLLMLAAFATASAFAAEPAAGPVARPKALSHELTRAEFEQLLTKPDELLIIDLRRPDELTRIGGFPVYLSIQAKDLEQQLAWIPKDRTIVTVSNHAARSGRAADLLTAKGYKVAGLLGAQTYEEQGGKLTKIEVPQRAAPASAAAQSAAKN
jgi:rhodanese-related sulfurtransferase